ncbi:hypothetical protein ACPPVW_18660 [Leifsonia sp. McL0607]|uniref:hypothetical protein n=1 Tax=Leifsonia sp. McL0607 TaxID=3415672 RepID=UPI003CF9FBF8
MAKARTPEQEAALERCRELQAEKESWPQRRGEAVRAALALKLTQREIAEAFGGMSRESIRLAEKFGA